MLNYTSPIGFYLRKSFNVAVTGTSQIVDLGTNTAYVQNIGAGKVFISPNPATISDFELAVGERLIFPLTGVINAISDSTATLKIMYVDPFLN